MQVPIYTEQAYQSSDHVHCCGFGSCHCPIRITWDKVKSVLERAVLPGIERETYIVIAH